MRLATIVLTICITVLTPLGLTGQTGSTLSPYLVQNTPASIERAGFSSDSLIRIQRSDLEQGKILLIDEGHFEELDSTVQIYEDGRLIIGNTQQIVDYLQKEEQDLKDWLVIILILSILVILVVLLIWIFWWRYKKVQQSRALLLSQINVLKNQMSPHFLYNSLNFIAEFIVNNPKQAEKSIKELAEVYEFVVRNFNKEIIPLESELDMIRTYAQILKYRFGPGFELVIDIENPEIRALPPLTLQILLENALKHNECSEASPLTVSILSEGDFLVVKNNLNTQNHSAPSAMTGMEILSKRFELHSRILPEVSSTESEFLVKVPLIKMTTL
ncbi:MAG: hypothetical protein Roseis2KO_11600 [Roseivirga sp.]